MPRLSLKILVFFLMLVPFPAMAAEGTLFVSEVTVDATAEDAASARTKAFADAEAQGLADLLEKLAPDQKDKILNSLDPAKITALVRGTEVIEEKILGNRYRGQLRLSYAADGVNQLIDRKISAVGGEEDKRTSTLIIPLLEEGDKVLLWENGNLWREIWHRIGVEYAGGQVVVPYGDTLDTGTLEAGNALAANYAAYLPLIRRYGTRDVVVLQGRFKDEEKHYFEVVKRVLDRSRNEVTLLSYQADPQESTDMLLTRAARDVGAQLAQRSSEIIAQRAMAEGEKGRQLVVVGFSTVQGWNSLRERLKAIPTVETIEMVAIAPRQADMLIAYRGPAEALFQAISAQGIAVRENGNHWIIEGK